MKKWSFSGFILLLFLASFWIVMPAEAAASWVDVASDVGNMLENASEFYAQGDVEAARKQVDAAYFGPFEEQGMEAAVKMNISASRSFELEYGFTEIKQLMKSGAELGEVEQKIKELMIMVNEDALMLDQNGGSDSGPWSGFMSAFLIMLREGLEAILVLAAIIAYLIKTGNKEKVATIYRAALAAIAASILTAWLIGAVFQLSGAAQEVLEGMTMLLAMVVLFFVSYWLLSKVEAKKWQQYIQGKIKDSLVAGKSWTLWWAVFLAVYREGAETVLFYQALLAGGAAISQVIAGLLVGAALLVVVFILVRLGSVRIPLKPFFAVTGALLYYMAFTFAGQGVKELQESGWITASAAKGVPVIDFLGIYPTWQSLGLQAALLAAAIFAIAYHWRKPKQGGGREKENISG